MNFLLRVLDKSLILIGYLLSLLVGAAWTAMIVMVAIALVNLIYPFK